MVEGKYFGILRQTKMLSSSKRLGMVQTEDRRNTLFLLYLNDDSGSRPEWEYRTKLKIMITFLHQPTPQLEGPLDTPMSHNDLIHKLNNP